MLENLEDLVRDECVDVSGLAFPICFPSESTLGTDLIFLFFRVP